MAFTNLPAGAYAGTLKEPGSYYYSIDYMLTNPSYGNYGSSMIEIDENGALYVVYDENQAVSFANLWVLTDDRIKSISQNCFIDMAQIEEIVLPSNIESVGKDAFATGAESITIYYDGPLSDDEITHGNYYFDSTITVVRSLAPATGDKVKVATSKLIALADAIRAKSGGNKKIALNNIPITIIKFNSDTPGTYDASGNLLKSWNELIADGDVIVTDGYLETPVGESTRFADAKLIIIPDDVTRIGTGAFDSCKNLTLITIPNSVTSINVFAFSGCKSLTEITIPNNVTIINAHTFRNCTGLTEITIPNSVTSIGKLAFRNCTGLTEITIPNSVTTINADAFEACTNLATIHYTGTATGAPWGATNATVVP